MNDIKDKENTLPVLTMCPASKAAPIIRPVGEICNLKCSYCYYHNDNQEYDKKQIMSTQVLETFIQQYLALYEGNIEFMWHGGEPMLAGLDFYNKVIKLQDKYKTDKHKIENNIQTNGTLINDKWAAFFKEHNFYIGLSLDGIKECHNKYRKNTHGDGTFYDVLYAINTLRKFDIEPGVLQTITKSSLPYIKSNFDFFIDELKIKKWGVNIYNDINNTNPILHHEVLTPDEYFQVYKEIYLLWKERNDLDIDIREIQTAVCAVLGKFTGMCTTSGICSSFIAIDASGNVSPSCDNYLTSKLGYNLGNILEKSLIEMLNSETRISFSKIVNAQPTKCKHCEWYSGCYNGCVFQRSKNNYLYCEGRKKLFSFIREDINHNV